MAISTALLSMVGGCTDRLEDAGIPVGNTVITASMDDAQGATRSAIDPTEYIGGHVGILWTPEDRLGVFGSADSNVPFNNMSTTPVGRTQFTGNMTNGAPLYAYYPYTEENNGADVTALKGTLPLVQQYDRTTGVLTGDYKYGTPREDAENEFNFRHLFSLLHFSVSLSGTSMESETLKKVKLTLPENRVLGGDFTFNAITGEYTFAESAAKANTVTMKVEGSPVLGSSNTYQGYVSCAPDMKADDEITIQVYTDKHVASFTKHIAYDFEPNAVYHFDLALSGYGSDVTVTDAPAEPEITRMFFSAAYNEGKILNHEVTNASGKPGATSVRTTDGVVSLELRNENELYAYIPYLNNRNLVPTIEVPEGVRVYNGETEVISNVTTVDFLSNPTLRVINNADEERLYTVKLENTGLPVVVINQSSTSLTESFLDLKVRAKTADFPVNDVISIYNADGSLNVDHVNGGVRLRGNTTQGWDKKPFAIKFDKKQSVLGMPKHKRWVLLASRIDRSLLRNNVTYHMARMTQDLNGANGMIWNPRGQNVELVIDGRHVGNYYLCEQIKIGADRLNINDNYEDRQSDGKTVGVQDCGYLLEIDYHFDETYKFNSATRGLPVMFKDDVLGDENFNWVKSRFNQVEEYLASGNYTAAYELIDVNSIIDNWLIYEITMNNEYGNPGSVYYYINGTAGDVPGDGKFHAGCVWDFDWATYHNPTNRIAYGDYYANQEQPDYTRFLYEAYNQTQNSQTGKKMYIWIPVLMKDPNFRAKVQERWTQIYATLSSGIPAYIREQGALNSRSFEINDAMWPAPYTEAVYSGNDRVYNGDEKISGYDAIIENLVNCFSSRLEWLNGAITKGNFPTSSK